MPACAAGYFWPVTAALTSAAKSFCSFFRPFPEDTTHFHGVLQQTCGPDRYARFSQWAREYFFLPHRGSERGVGGIFFDYLRGEEEWRFVQQVGDAFLPAK